MAIGQRRIRPRLIHYSEQGAQYSCVAYPHELATRDITRGMSRRGNCYDNAVVESFFSTLKNDLVHHQTYHTRDETSREIFAFMEGSIIARGSIRASAISARWSSNDGSVGLNPVSAKPGLVQSELSSCSSDSTASVCQPLGFMSPHVFNRFTCHCSH